MARVSCNIAKAMVSYMPWAGARVDNKPPTHEYGHREECFDTVEDARRRWRALRQQRVVDHMELRVAQPGSSSRTRGKLVAEYSAETNRRERRHGTWPPLSRKGKAAARSLGRGRRRRQ